MSNLTNTGLFKLDKFFISKKNKYFSSTVKAILIQYCPFKYLAIALSLLFLVSLKCLSAKIKMNELKGNY